MSSPDRRPLVLVAVGTDYHPFDRLVGWVDRWARDHKDVDVLVQYGSSTPPATARGSQLLGHSELQDAMAAADVVVCHGGPATISEARRHGRLPICVPRDPQLGEHVDEHQQLFARRMGSGGVVHLAETEPALVAAMNDALARPDRFSSGRDSGDGAGAGLAGSVPGLERFADLVGELLPPVEPERRVPVLYIGGLGRSGSTLLERALGQVDGFVCIGEVVHLWERGLRDDELCGCGAAFSACTFWQRVGKSAYGGWDKVDAGAVLALKASVDRTRFVPRLTRATATGDFARRLRRYTDLLTRLYAAVLEVSGAEVVVDASKHATTALALRTVPALDLHVVHAVRDSPAVAYSWTKQVRRPEASNGDLMASWSPAKTAVHWTSENLLLDRGARLGTPTSVVRYEDFVADPKATLARLLRFMGRDDTEPLLGFVDGHHLELTPSHTVAGNPMRFTNGGIDIVADDAWRSALPEGQQRLVRGLTRPLRGRFGYRGGDDR